MERGSTRKNGWIRMRRYESGRRKNKCNGLEGYGGLEVQVISKGTVVRIIYTR